MSGSSGIPLYARYWWDDRLKLFHVRHRVYDPRAGRFLQRDPIGYAGGSNLYMYAWNSPFRYVDPMGLDSYLIGSGLRGIGLDDWGDIADDFVDGARELGDTLAGLRTVQDIAHAGLIGATNNAQAQHAGFLAMVLSGLFAVVR